MDDADADSDSGLPVHGAAHAGTGYRGAGAEAGAGDVGPDSDRHAPDDADDVTADTGEDTVLGTTVVVGVAANELG